MATDTTLTIRITADFKPDTYLAAISESIPDSVLRSLVMGMFMNSIHVRNLQRQERQPVPETLKTAKLKPEDLRPLHLPPL